MFTVMRAADDDSVYTVLVSGLREGRFTDSYDYMKHGHVTYKVTAKREGEALVVNNASRLELDGMRISCVG